MAGANRACPDFDNLFLVSIIPSDCTLMKFLIKLDRYQFNGFYFTKLNLSLSLQIFSPLVRGIISTCFAVAFYITSGCL